MAEDDYFLALCRYVEANALRAGLVERAEDWRECGLWRRAHGGNGPPLADWPVERPRNWVARVNRRLPDGQLEEIRGCVPRGRPLGPEAWVLETAAHYFQRIYSKHRDQGKGHRNAIVIVARHLARVVWRLLTDDRPFTKRRPKNTAQSGKQHPRA